MIVQNERLEAERNVHAEKVVRKRSKMSVTVCWKHFKMDVSFHCHLANGGAVDIPSNVWL